MDGVVKKSKLYLQKHSPTILTLLGSTGVVLTAVSAVRVTPKAMRLLEEATDEKGEELTNLEAVQATGKVYIPTILIGTTTIACIFGANILNKHSQAVIASAYALLNESYDKYRSTVRTMYGEDTDDAIIERMVTNTEDVYISHDGSRIYTPSEDESDRLLFYDYTSKAYFDSTMANVITAQYHINRNLVLRGEVSLNEYYEFLGLDSVEKGDILGWGSEFFSDGNMWLDFKNSLVILEDGLECIVVYCLTPPEILQ